MIALQLTHDDDPTTDHAAAVRRQFEDMLSEISEPYSSVLRMVELEGVSLADAASLLVLREASLRLIYREGRRRLREVVMRHSEAGRL